MLSFEVHSYDGGEESKEYGIENIFHLNKYPHCSSKGDNWTLILKYTGENYFSLSNFTIQGPTNCTCPIRNGYVFITDEVPKKEYLENKENGFVSFIIKKSILRQAKKHFISKKIFQNIYKESLLRY
jgi:hypothetical protein